MSIIHTWKAKNCSCYNQMYGRSGVVFSVELEVTATNSETGYSNSEVASVGVPWTDPAGYLPIDDVTPELALAWAMDYLSPTEKQRLEILATGNIEKVSVKTFGTGGA